MYKKQFLQLFVALLLNLLHSQAFALDSNYFISPRSKVSLISEQDQITPGEEFWLALKFQQSPDWHIYWKNPGDSGLPAKLEWEEHQEVTFDSEIIWERPDVITVDHLLNYGFARPETLLLIKAYLKKDFKGEMVEIKLGADWLICKVDCVPESNTFVLNIPVGPKVLGKSAGNFNDSFNRLPIKDRFYAEYQRVNSELQISFHKLPAIIGRPHFVFNAPSISQNTLNQKFNQQKLSLKVSPETLDIPNNLSGVLLDLDQNNHSLNAFEFQLEHNKTGTTLASTESELLTSTITPAEPSSSLLRIIIFALIGGLLLNLMPCVFPIISIKVLDFINLSSQDPRIARKHSLSFAAGIISFMLALAILAETLKAFGENLGWGFQLQSPIFVSCLAILFYLIGLSFAGYFYVGDMLMSKTAAIKVKKTYFGSFLNGALATLVATPCTAPFMGTALGATISLNFYLSLLVFLSLGIGISLPFVVLTFNQNLMRRMPRPGAWMEKLKEIMSFLMFLTCLWLLWIIAGLTTAEYSISLLFSFVVLTFLIWIQKNFLPATSLLKFFKHLLSVGLLIVAISPILISSSYQTSASLATGNAYGLPFQKFSEKLLASELASGKAVYIDFTARWCITCQVNKKRVFSSNEVRELFKKNDVSLLVADWTNKDEDIKKSLNKYGRNSVPLNIIYKKNSNLNTYQVLPSLLSAQDVVESFNQ